MRLEASLTTPTKHHTHTEGKSAMATIDDAASTLFCTEIFRGMAMTLNYFWRKPATIYYPFEKVSRILHALGGTAGGAFHSVTTQRGTQLALGGLLTNSLDIVARFVAGSALPSLPRRACASTVPEWRGAVHRVQALRGHLPGTGDHD